MKAVQLAKSSAQEKQVGGLWCDYFPLNKGEKEERPIIPDADKLLIACPANAGNRIVLPVQPLQDCCSGIKLFSRASMIEQTQHPTLPILLVEAQDIAPIEVVMLEGLDIYRMKSIGSFNKT